MPGTTSRGYPYPLDTDPIDVAGDMQKLAEAINTDVIASNDFRRFDNKTQLDTWAATNGAMASTPEDGGSTYQRRNGVWIRTEVMCYGRGNFSAPSLGGNANLTLAGAVYNFAGQDSWGVRPLVEGLYAFTANAVHSAGNLGGGYTWNVSIDKYTWANPNAPAESTYLFNGNPVAWTALSVTAVCVMNVGDWYRLNIQGDAGGTIDGRSTWNCRRVGPIG
jgi:hypothetical protein